MKNLNASLYVMEEPKYNWILLTKDFDLFEAEKKILWLFEVNK